MFEILGAIGLVLALIVGAFFGGKRTGRKDYEQEVESNRRATDDNSVARADRARDARDSITQFDSDRLRTPDKHQRK